MKRIFIACFLLMFASVMHAGTISWNYTGVGGLGGTFSSGWAVWLYEDVNRDGFGGGFTWGADDVYAGVFTELVVNAKNGDIYYGANFSSPAGGLALGDYVYTVIFNNADAGLATEYIIVDASPYVLPATDVDSGYALSSVSGGWQAVPEPATIVLFGIGLATAGFASRKRKQAVKA